jgi:hypothetical protein
LNIVNETASNFSHFGLFSKAHGSFCSHCSIKNLRKARLL